MSRSLKRRLFRFAATVLAVAVIAFLVPRREITVRAHHAYAQVTGEAPGCSFWDVAMPLDLELDRAWLVANRSIVATSVESGLRLWTTPEGEFWAPLGTDLAFLLAEQRLDIYAATDPIYGIRPGDVVLDCGANVGTFTRKALDAGASLVVSVEVSPRNIESLERTFAAEIRQGRVTVVPVGVWHERSSMDLAVYDNSALDSLVMHTRHEEQREPTTVRVDLETIDELVEDAQLQALDFIKMDIEGAERNALRGARDVIRRFHPRVAIATENLGDDIAVLPDILKEIQPDYRISNGRCRIINPTLVRPEVVHGL